MIIEEIKAIVWKEWRELFFKQSLKNKLRAPLLIVIVGVAMPIHKGPDWFSMPFFLGIGLTGPFLMLLTIISDLFAGERERHTLETLLASQISDKGFIFGKISFAISYATIITFLLLLLNVITINIEYYHGTLIILSLQTFLVIVFLNFAGSITGSILGTIASLKASTVKQAQLAIFILLVILIFLPALLISHVPTEIKTLLVHCYTVLGLGKTIFLISVFILMINWFGLLYILKRYKRAKIFS